MPKRRKIGLKSLWSKIRYIYRLRKFGDPETVKKFYEYKRGKLKDEEVPEEWRDAKRVFEQLLLLEKQESPIFRRFKARKMSMEDFKKETDKHLILKNLENIAKGLSEVQKATSTIMIGASPEEVYEGIKNLRVDHVNLLTNLYITFMEGLLRFERREIDEIVNKLGDPTIRDMWRSLITQNGRFELEDMLDDEKIKKATLDIINSAAKDIKSVKNITPDILDQIFSEHTRKAKEKGIQLVEINKYLRTTENELIKLIRSDPKIKKIIEEIIGGAEDSLGVMYG